MTWVNFSMNIVASETSGAQSWLANLVNEAKLHWVTPVPEILHLLIASWSNSFQVNVTGYHQPHWESGPSPTPEAGLCERGWGQHPRLKTSFKLAELSHISAEIISSKANRDESLVLVSSQVDVASTEILGDLLACSFIDLLLRELYSVVSGLGKNACDTSGKVFVFPQHMSPYAQPRPYRLDSKRNNFFWKHTIHKEKNYTHTHTPAHTCTYTRTYTRMHAHTYEARLHSHTYLVWYLGNFYA